MTSRSPNCNSYTDFLSLFVDGSAHVPGQPRCSVSVSSFSCQSQESGHHEPDDVTDKFMRAKASEQLSAMNCDPSNIVMDYKTFQVGTQYADYSAEKLNKLGMTSNCYRDGNDPNHATHRARAVCYPMEAMTDNKGNRIKNTHMQFSSSLAVCDASDEAMPQVQEDLRKVAAYNAGQHGYHIAKQEDLACSLSLLPML